MDQTAFRDECEDLLHSHSFCFSVETSYKISSMLANKSSIQLSNWSQSKTTAILHFWLNWWKCGEINFKSFNTLSTHTSLQGLTSREKSFLHWVTTMWKSKWSEHENFHFWLIYTGWKSFYSGNFRNAALPKSHQKDSCIQISCTQQCPLLVK